MPNGVPAGLLALAGSGQLGQVPLGRQPTFQSALTGSLGLLSQAQQGQGQRGDRQFDQMLQIAEMEQQIRQAEAAQAQAAQKRAAKQAYVQGLPPELQALGGFATEELAKEQAKSAFPDPTGRFKVVGTDLFDVSGAQPQLAARGRRASEPLVPVYDPATGTTTYQQRGAAAGKMPPPPRGLKVTTGPDGQTIVETNVQGGMEIGTKGRGTIEDQMIALTGAKQRMDFIKESWNPRYSLLQERGLKWGQELLAQVDLLPESQREDLKNYAVYRQDTLSNANQSIKDLTGASMSVQEAGRILDTLPNPDDSPPTFEAKLENVMRKAQLSYARLAIMRQRGLPMDPNFGGISLNQTKDIINKRGQEIEDSLRQQGFDEQEISATVDQQLKQEFDL